MQGQRVIAVAYRSLANLPDPKANEESLDPSLFLASNHRLRFLTTRVVLRRRSTRIGSLTEFGSFKVSCEKKCRVPFLQSTRRAAPREKVPDTYFLPIAKTKVSRMLVRWMLVLATAVFLSYARSNAGDGAAVDAGRADSESTDRDCGAAAIHQQVENLWRVTWKRFYLPRTNLFYDYLSSFEPGQELAHLPTAAEVQRQYPNECGYDTGMEDGMISAGVMLSLIVDRYAVTQQAELRERADDVFKGIRLCAAAHGVPGFLARAVCAEDLKSVYPNSSRDQYTHAVHGLWLYARSPLCSQTTRGEIGVILRAIADRMTANVIPENDYDSLRIDGSRDTRGISRMWHVQAHEAARLPMIYAAAWDVTGEPAYYELYRKYLKPAIEQSKAINGREPTYSYLQMQASLELLSKLERDGVLLQTMRELMTTVAEHAAARARSAGDRAENLDLTMVCSDWRSGEGLSATGRYRPVWYCIRESGEAAMTQLMLETPLSSEQHELMESRDPAFG